MPKRPGRPDFNQQVHALFEHIAAGESPDANGEPGAAAEDAEPAPARLSPAAIARVCAVLKAEGADKDTIQRVERLLQGTEDPAAAAGSLGRIGGPKGGRARMDALSAEERTELGRKAAAARWGKKDGSA